MKKLLFIIALSGFFSSCEERQKQSYYVVHKEYTPKGQCCDDRKTICEAGFVPVRPVVVPHSHHHETQNATYVLFLANKDNRETLYTTEKFYKSVKCGQKVIY